MTEEKKNSQAQSEQPLFSIIVLTYLQRHLLEDCLDSILKQTYPNIELVICDDCSADFDEDDVRAYIDENKGENIRSVVIFKQPQNVGTVKNAQMGVELSSGVLFKLQAGDDMLYGETAMEKMAKFLSNPAVHIIAARSVACQHDGMMTGTCYPALNAVNSMIAADAQTQFELIGTQSWGEFINAPAVCWKRAFFDEMGGFDLSYKYTEDWPMWLKITGAGHRITMVNELVSVYRYGGISNARSATNLILGKEHYRECIRMLKEYALPVFESSGNRRKVLRCQQSIRCLEVRADVEGQWEYWSCWQQILWRLNHLNFLLTSWLYRKRYYGAAVTKKGPLTAMAISLLMYMFHVQIIPGYSVDFLWAWAFFAAALWLFVKLVFVGCIKLMNFILNTARRGRG